MDLIDAVINAPIKTLLVLSGLVFIATAIAGKVGSWVELSQKSQRFIAGAVGGTLLVVGISLNTVPTSDNGASPNPAPLIEVSPVPTTQTSDSQISMFFGDTWQPINPLNFEDYWEDVHPITEQKRDAFLIAEEQLNSLNISTGKINATVAQLGREWLNNAPDTWDGKVIKCFVAVQRRDRSLKYIPCQVSGSSGECQFPWQLDSVGRRCGGRAASERPGG